MTPEYTCVWLGVTRPTFPKGCFLKQKFKDFEVGCMRQVLMSLVHWEDPEELGGEGGERGDRDGEYMSLHG